MKGFAILPVVLPLRLQSAGYAKAAGDFVKEAMTELRAVSLKGDMNLHYIDAAGVEKVVVIREGEIIYCPAGTPHSPRFPRDAFVLVLERKRRAGERDKFSWFCEKCRTPLFESVKVVSDYREDPVSRVYEEFYSEDKHRTCGKCGHVTARPAG
jgi:3-hydroxyanthranilate 3,4-dioxygenase